MNNILKAESYKLMHSSSFWGIFFSSLVLGSILLADSSRLIEGMLNASLYNTPFMYFLVIIFAVLFIGEDFGNRTLHCFISSGHKRESVLFVKTVIYLAACEAILIGPLLLHSLVGVMVGNTGGLSMPDFLTKAVFAAVAVLAMGMLPLASAFVFKDVGRTLAVPLVIFFLMIFVLNSSYYRRIAVILPIGQLRLLSQNEPAAAGMVVLGIDVLWIFLLYVISYASLRRSDLK